MTCLGLFQRQSIKKRICHTNYLSVMRAYIYIMYLTHCIERPNECGRIIKMIFKNFDPVILNYNYCCTYLCARLKHWNVPSTARTVWMVFYDLSVDNMTYCDFHYFYVRFELKVDMVKTKKFFETMFRTRARLWRVYRNIIPRTNNRPVTSPLIYAWINHDFFYHYYQRAGMIKSRTLDHQQCLHSL